MTTRWSQTCAVGVGHVGDAEVDVGGQAPVELDLSVADPLRVWLPLAEVQEAEVDWLLDLVGAIAEEEDGRGVGLGDVGVAHVSPAS